MPVRTILERGPKGKRSVAFALDWPGWNRGAKTADLALETLESYRGRYRLIADLAGMAREFDAAGPLEVVEDRVGPGSVDFWGISFSPSSTEHGPMDEAAFDRAITLLRAAWAFFDSVAARVSPEMRKGPRGGGRDRDRIIRHTIRTESEDFAKQVGLRIPEEAALTPDGLRQHRETYVAAMRAYNAGEVEKRMRSWTLPFLIRHSAFHTLDHAWEMEDKDMSSRGRGLVRGHRLVVRVCGDARRWHEPWSRGGGRRRSEPSATAARPARAGIGGQRRREASAGGDRRRDTERERPSPGDAARSPRTRDRAARRAARPASARGPRPR